MKRLSLIETIVLVTICTCLGLIVVCGFHALIAFAMTL